MTLREAQLAQSLAQRDAELAQARLQIEELRAANLVLQRKLDALIRRIFKTRSESLDPAQLELLLEAEANDEAKKAAPLGDDCGLQGAGESAEAQGEPKARQPRRERDLAHLPVEEVILDPDVVRENPAAWRCIDEEVHEQLDYTPGAFKRIRTIRRKYVSRAQREDAPVIAPLPPTLQERCTAAPGLIAHIITAKFYEHSTLYRLEQGFALRHGVNIGRQTMGSWMGLAAFWLEPVRRHLARRIFATGYVQIDETPVAYLSPGNGQTRTGYFWVIHSPCTREVLVHWSLTRAAATLHEIIPPGWSGVLQCDGYSAYAAFLTRRARADDVIAGAPRIARAGCLAHVRRGFFEAKDNAPGAAAVFLKEIARLYRIEEELRTARAGPEERLRRRQAESRPILDALQQKITEELPRHLPKSSMGAALTYAQHQWEHLQVFLSDGRVEIDNNLVENAIRPTAIGKKNWLFIGEAAAGHRAATLYTLAANCRAAGIDPYAYFRDALTRLPAMTTRQVPELLPQTWATARRATHTQATLAGALS